MYRIAEDIELVKELLGCSASELAEAVGVSRMTLNRWKDGSVRPSHAALEAFYGYTFRRGLRLNAIKAQLSREQTEAAGNTPLFHGAKTELTGAPALGHAKASNDLGPGFYTGETLEQSAMFVAGYPQSSLYLLSFDQSGLRAKEYAVDREWMLAVAWYRGKLAEYADHPLIQGIRTEHDAAQYLSAPIADNRMFAIIDSFIDGEITDVQCQHCLSATNLGRQIVFTTQEAIGRLQVLERCFIADAEKRAYLESRHEEAKIGADKVKVARRTFRGHGLYIDELLS